MNQPLAARIARPVALVTSLALVGGGLGACTTTASGTLDAWVAVLKAEVGDFVPPATIDAEAEALASYVD